MIQKGILLEEILKYAGKYHFSFQFWGEGNNNAYIDKEDVEIYSCGGYDTPEECMSHVLDFIYRINQIPAEKQLYNVNPNF